MGSLQGDIKKSKIQFVAGDDISPYAVKGSGDFQIRIYPADNQLGSSVQNVMYKINNSAAQYLQEMTCNLRINSVKTKVDLFQQGPI